MRLIDADKLIEDLCSFFPKEALEGIESQTLFKQIITDIVNSPTIKQLDKTTLCSTCDLKDANYKKGFSDGFEEGRKTSTKIERDDLFDSLFKEDNDENES